ncbi:hypothetical protein BDP27DRAFT_1188848, partial [Rhodocollybia butyracea]
VEDIRIAQQYINTLRAASLKNGDLDEATLDLLSHPIQEPFVLGETDDNKDLFLSMELFLGLINGSQDEYTAAATAFKRRCPEVNPLSYERVRKQVLEISGVRPIVNDMCPNSCMAYTGPFAEHNSCIKCGESRYWPGTEIRRQEFHTLPIAPYI